MKKIIKPKFPSLVQYEERDDDILIRRYFKIRHFEKFIQYQALYFSPASEFKDKLEGHYTYRDYKEVDVSFANSGFSNRDILRAQDARHIVASINKRASVISCWTKDNEDDLRKFKEYGPIAAETNLRVLRKMIGSDFLFIPVIYLDFYKEKLPNHHSLVPFFYKSEDYKWEKEIRIVGEMEIGKRIGTPRLVPVCIEKMLYKVIVSPLESDKFYRKVSCAVKSVAPEAIVIKSKLKISKFR